MCPGERFVILPVQLPVCIAALMASASVAFSVLELSMAVYFFTQHHMRCECEHTEAG